MKKNFFVLGVTVLMFGGVWNWYNKNTAKAQNEMVEPVIFTETISEFTTEETFSVDDFQDSWMAETGPDFSAQDGLYSGEMAKEAYEDLVSSQYFFVDANLVASIRTVDENMYFGQFQVMSTGETYSGIQSYFKMMYDLDSTFFEGLERYSKMSNAELFDSNIVLNGLFDELRSRDFYKLAYAELKAFEIMNQNTKKELGLEWIDSSMPGLSGLVNWNISYAPFAGWDRSVDPNKSEAQNIVAIYNFWLKAKSGSMNKLDIAEINELTGIVSAALELS